jgi:ribonuclease-3
MSNKKFENFEKKINHVFKDKELLIKALTHKTYAFEAKTPIEFNERLELLGDSILGFVVAEKLYKTNKYFSEGELTRRRSQFVNNTFLAEKAKKLGIGKILFLGKGEEKQNGSTNKTNLANALEALIGAVYLDSGMVEVRKFISENIYSSEYDF